MGWGAVSLCNPWLLADNIGGGGGVVRRYVWTVVHSIDESSPLYQESWESLAGQAAELHVIFSGVDSESMEEICVSKRYTMGAVLFDAAFLPLLDRSKGAVRPQGASLLFNKTHRVAMRTV